MISEKTLSALLNYELHKNSSDKLDQLFVTSQAKEHGLLKNNLELKDECKNLLNSMKTSMNQGASAEAVTTAACQVFSLPRNEPRELYESLRT